MPLVLTLFILLYIDQIKLEERKDAAAAEVRHTRRPQLASKWAHAYVTSQMKRYNIGALELNKSSVCDNGWLLESGV